MKYILLILLFISNCVFSQKNIIQRKINWNSNKIIKKNFPSKKERTSRQKSINNNYFIENKTETIHFLNFDNAVYDNLNTLLPYYYEVIKLDKYHSNFKIDLINQKFETFNDKNLENIKFLEILSSEIELTTSIYYQRKIPFIQLSFIPLRKNPGTNKIEKLVSFSIKTSLNPSNTVKENTQTKKLYSQNSVLHSGKWIKIKINKDGIYKLTYSELLEMGFTDPQNIRIFGNGGSMLPIMNSEPRFDDLIENRIHMEYGTDDIFNDGDYILFYGQGTNIWKYDEVKNLFVHSKHLYSDTSCYFLTSENGTGKKISIENSLTQPATNNVTSFNDFRFHEEDLVNLIKSGRQWYGELFDIITSYNFTFSFPNLDTSSPLELTSQLLARSPLMSSFNIRVNMQNIATIEIESVNLGNYASIFAREKTNTTSFYATNENIPVDIIYNKSSYSSKGWLNYLLINARRNLEMYDSQMHFRDVESVGAGNISTFHLSNVNSNIKIWDITEPYNIKQIETSLTAGTLKFALRTDSLREFIAFDGSLYLSPEIIGEIPNQNLHGSDHQDMIIVSHQLFLTYANQLAEIHRSQDNLKVVVVTSEQIYNEFSSGMADVCAIRDFIKMLYDRASSENEIPRYLLLFGDGSYDNKSNDINNTNFILTYQSENSINPAYSFVTDDFFGLLDDNEGGATGLLDVGIGRFPVKSVEEAQSMIDKVLNYTNVNTMGDWRNSLCFIADDEDNNIHMKNANALTTLIDTTYPEYIIEKIFLDAYPQISTPNGERYPEVNTAINNKINKGTLIINYIGHGNELKLAHENILGINDIASWENMDKLPLFITATCEFSRFDDIGRNSSGKITQHTSAGEHILLNQNGGGIALLSTTRLVYSDLNFILNRNFYKYVFQKDKNYRLGDVLRLTKIISGSSHNKRNFTLLGDPALQLAYPKNIIITDSINGKNISVNIDTLKALSQVKISGYIEASNGIRLNDFNGTISPVVFDKVTTLSTLSNDGTPKMNFDVQNNILYKGKASVTNGNFSFTFIIPKDISYNLGFGKISYYAHNNNYDAHGYCKNILIGGSADSLITDNRGPSINLYMNNKNFVFGGITDENPILLAFVKDGYGINTVGSGIGHDITAILDNNPSNLIVLNDYYESDINSYRSGKIEYQLSGLSAGNHNLLLKVWDIFNNSSEEYIEFVVAESSELILERVYNFPNPFTTHTSFCFEHNQPQVDLEVLIQIFSLSGELVKTIETNIFSNGFRIEPINWDGRDNYGNKIGRGIYIYRIKIRSTNGQVVEKFEKLVIL